MTDREAIDVLLKNWKCVDRNDGIHCKRKCVDCDLAVQAQLIRQAYNLAIEALEQKGQGKTLEW